MTVAVKLLLHRHGPESGLARSDWRLGGELPRRFGAACRRPDGFPPAGDSRSHPIAWCGNTCRPLLAGTRVADSSDVSSLDRMPIGTTKSANSRFCHGRVRLSAPF